MAAGDTTFAEAGGVRLCIQTFGDRRDPAILLISGMSASMDWWDEEFCARLAAGLRYMIRYDHRDTGQSACYPPGAPSYTGGDLVADAVAVLDALGVDTAHLVGISMGGAIGEACRRHPHTSVHYHTADLLDPPNHWLHAFDLVVEIITVQALPDPPRHQAIVNVGRLVAPGGTLLAIAAAHGEAADAGSGPPWPLTRAEIDAFATGDLTPASVELISDGDTARSRACFHREPSAPSPQGR